MLRQLHSMFAHATRRSTAVLVLAVLVSACGDAASDETSDSERTSVGLSALTFTLVNATNGQPIPGFNPLVDGATITLASLPTQRLTIHAASAGAVGSMKFQLDAMAPHTESVVPYSLCGDQGIASSTSCPELNVLGAHSLTVTPYSEAMLGGSVGAPVTIRFTVQATSAAHSVALHWAASTTSGVTYKVYRGSVSGGPYTQVASGLTTLGFTDAQVQSGKTYFYISTALNSSNVESVHSNQFVATIP